MKVLAVGIQKGGTGKTTTALTLAQAAIYRGHSCLLIDLDPQANASFAVGADTRGKGSFDFIQGAAAVDVIQSTGQGLDIIPATWNLATVTTTRGSARRLQKAIQPLKKDYDLIIIDTPTKAGELQYNALQAATGLIIPLWADTYNLQSFYQTTDLARQMQRSNPELEITGIVFTMYDKRSTLTRQMKETITEQAAAIGVPCLGEIRIGIAIREAAALQQSLYKYAPKSKPAADYLAIFDKI